MMDADRRCSIYTGRPKICRDHGNTEGECEFYDNPYHMYFTTLQEFERYLNDRGKQWQFKYK